MRASLRKATRFVAVAFVFASAGWSVADDAPPAPPAPPAPAPRCWRAGSRARCRGNRLAHPAAAAPKPFAEVIKGAKEIPGYLKLYEKEDKVWIAIRPDPAR